jgi:hypothetical protein
MKRAISRFLDQPLRRKLLFTRVSVMLLAVHLSMRLFPFADVYRFLKRYHRVTHSPAVDRRETEEICWAVTRAGRTWFGDAGCLAQALVGELLLVRRGVPAQLRIGVRRDGAGALLAHAWVEENQQILIGGRASIGPVEFQALPDIQHLVESLGGRS